MDRRVILGMSLDGRARCRGSRSSSWACGRLCRGRALMVPPAARDLGALGAIMAPVTIQWLARIMLSTRMARRLLRMLVVMLRKDDRANGRRLHLASRAG